MRILTLPPSRVVRGFEDFFNGDMRQLDKFSDRSHPPRLLDVLPVDHITLNRHHPLESNWLENVRTVAWSFILQYENDQLWDCEIGDSDTQFHSMGNRPALKQFLHEAAKATASEENPYEYRFLKSIPPFPIALRMVGPVPRVIVSDLKGTFTLTSEEEFAKDMIRIDIERRERNSRYTGDSIGG